MDTYIIMPNHFHCNVIIGNDNFVPPAISIGGNVVDTIHETAGSIPPKQK